MVKVPTFDTTERVHLVQGSDSSRTEGGSAGKLRCQEVAREFLNYMYALLFSNNDALNRCTIAWLSVQRLYTYSWVGEC